PHSPMVLPCSRRVILSVRHALTGSSPVVARALLRGRSCDDAEGGSHGANTGIHRGAGGGGRRLRARRAAHRAVRRQRRGGSSGRDLAVTRSRRTGAAGRRSARAAGGRRLGGSDGRVLTG